MCVAPYISSQVLSQQRASAVVKYLGNNDIQRKNIEDIGYGESKPETSNNNKKGRVLNRKKMMFFPKQLILLSFSMITYSKYISLIY